MKKRIAILLSALLVLLMTVPAVSALSFPPGTVIAGHFAVQYLGKSYDGTNTTFSYSIYQHQEGGNSFPALSHLTLALCSPLTVVGGSQSGITDPFKSATGLDPTTGLTGFKWDNGMTSAGPTTFTLTVAGNGGEQQVAFAIKAGTMVIHAEATGPACGDIIVELPGKLNAVKFYDVNGNGILDRDENGVALEPVISGWQITLDGVAAYTESSGTVSWTGLVNGQEYEVAEVMASTGLSGVTWKNITPLSVLATASQSDEPVYFGNQCVTRLTANGTIGFWSNKNGEAKFNSTAASLEAVKHLHHKRTTFVSYNQVRTYLRGATAEDMDYMLAAQLIAAKLNALHFTNPATPVGATTLGQLLADAEAALWNGSLTKAEKEVFKNALDAFNNNFYGNEVINAPGLCSVIYN